MIDSQAQVRWLAAAAALIVFVIGPVTAGKLFPKVETTNFTVFDMRSTEMAPSTGQPAEADSSVIFLVPPGTKGECAPEAMDACPSLDNDVLVVPMSSDVVDTSDRLQQVYRGLRATAGAATLTSAKESFGWKWALVVGALLLIGALLAVGGLAARQPRRLGLVPEPSDPPPSPPLPRDAVPTLSPRQSVPSRRPPVLTLAAVPGAREVVREHGATAKARSHIDSAGGYVVLGDVLMWATPADGGVAYPDDDVRVAVAVSSTLDGGLRP